MTVRARLALWFVAVLAALVGAASAATYLIVRSQLRGREQSSAQVLATAAASADPEEASLDRLAGPADRIWVVGPGGTVIARTFGAPGTTLAHVRAVVARSGGEAVSAAATGPEGRTAVVLHGDASLRRTLSTIAWALGAVALGGLVVAAGAGVLLARRALAPVERIRAQVDAIPGTELERRIAEGADDELGRLARAFNRLLGRAEQAATEQERFVADASHELRSPITALEGHARIAARSLDRGDVEQARRSLEVVVDQARRLSTTVRELLSLAEGGRGPAALAPVALDHAVAAACEELAAETGREVRLEREPAMVLGDAGRLREVVRILVDNAIRYGGPGHAVDVGVSSSPSPRLTVRDHGPGMSDEDRERAFDRFYRGRASAGVPGSGLGLAIARVVCERHGAALALEPAPGGGTLATVVFPALETDVAA